MKKILLIAINSRYTHSNLSLYYLKAMVKDLEYDVKIKEFSINQDAVKIIEEIESEKPFGVAFSVYIWNVELIKHIIPIVKGHCPNTRIIVGGPEVSYNADTWLFSYPDVDYIIIGSGEKGFNRLLDMNLKFGSKTINIPNLPFPDIPFPYTDNDLKGLKNKYIYYESSRGCPFRCTYCLSSRSDQKFELKNIDIVKEELKFILKYRPKLLKFVDRTFNTRKEHYREIWKFLIENYGNSPTKFHFEIYPALLDKTDFEILSSCPGNLFQFEIGIQSTNQMTLKSIKRNNNWKRLKPVIQRLIDLKRVHIHLDLIAGLPYDNLSKVKTSINELYSLNANHLQIGFLKVLPGTEMKSSAENFGLIFSETAPYQILENRWLSSGELKLIEKIANLVNRLYNSHRFEVTMKNIIRLYSTPFDVYSELSLFMENHYSKPINRKWETCTELLLNFTGIKFPGMKKYFIDCLRWDWCKNSKSHLYPDLIKSEETARIKKVGFNFFNNFSENGILNYNGIIFNFTDLRRSIFFEPESKDFKNQYMDKNSAALFLPGKERVIFFNV